ncbi:MAG: ABC transporter ATP-binding protein [Acidimicrobiia bacterium]|nr:MAG: ABC transporter ATP-binding protein [Acidimicrobiia bacterium]
MTAVLTADRLAKSFGDRKAVDDVTFEIAAGETYGLLGPNGAGKTTTISMICGLLHKDAGTVVVDGNPIEVNSVGAREALGYVPQDLAIYPDLSAGENLSFFASLYGLSGAERQKAVDRVLDLTGLTDRAKDKAGEFSGGMKRRLNIGIGLLHGPKLLMLDEPTVGVDPQSRNAILDSVDALGTEGLAVLYTTHYMEEAERLCDRVGIIDQGQLIAEGTRRQLVATVGQRDRVTLETGGHVDGLIDRLRALPDVDQASVSDAGVEIVLPDAAGRLAEIISVVAEHTVVKGVAVHEPDLEAVFLHLTGKALRD